jgi:uncharacterized protein (TIGR02145 family)
LAIVEIENNEYAIINTTGKVVSPFTSFKFELIKEPDLFLTFDPKTHKKGAFDFSFRPAIPFQFDFITRLGDIFIVSIFKNSQIRYGIYNKKLESIFPLELEREPKESPKGFIKNVIKGKEGLFKISGELVLPFSYNSTSVYEDEDRIIATDTLRKCHIFNCNGKRISDDPFDNFYSTLVHGFVPVQKNGKWGLFKDGLNIPCLYDSGDDIKYANGYFMLKKGSKYGVTDSIGKEIVPYTFDKVTMHNKNMFLTVADNKYGIINSLGTVVVPCTMKYIPPQPQNGYFIFSDNNKYGCIKEDGTLIVPFVLDEAYVKTNYKTAAPYLAKIITIIPDDAWMTYLDALGYYSSSKPKDALEYVNRYINKYIANNIRIPNGLSYLRSMIYSDLNDFVAAEKNAYNSDGGGTYGYGTAAYLYLAEKKLLKEDYQGADDIYAKFFIPVTDQRRVRTIEELKKRGLYKPTVQNVVRVTVTPDADIPTTILKFTNSDRREASVNNMYKMLYSYSEAVEGIPQGYRMPTVDDWVKLFEYIKKDQSDKYGRHDAKGSDYVGTGWSKTYYTEGVINVKKTTYSSTNAYDLNISPLRTHKYIGLTGDERVNYIDYWMEPGYYKGKKVNRMHFNDDGYEFQYVDGGTACVRYVKK